MIILFCITSASFLYSLHTMLSARLAFWTTCMMSLAEMTTSEDSCVYALPVRASKQKEVLPYSSSVLNLGYWDLCYYFRPYSSGFRLLRLQNCLNLNSNSSLFSHFLRFLVTVQFSPKVENIIDYMIVNSQNKIAIFLDLTLLSWLMHLFPMFTLPLFIPLFNFFIFNTRFIHAIPKVFTEPLVLLLHV